MKQNSNFVILEPGLARKGGRIYCRVRVAGKWTWRSTETNELTLAKLWQQDWAKVQWLAKQGYVAQSPLSPASRNGSAATTTTGIQPDGATQSTQIATVNELLDCYVEAKHPTVKKRKLKRKSARSIENETYALAQLRQYFGKKVAAQLTLGDCDTFHAWRLGGGYVAKFVCRGKAMTRTSPGGDRAVDLNLIVLSNALELAVRQGKLTSNPIRDRGQYADDSQVRHCREVAPTPNGLVLIVDWFEKNDSQQDADITRYLAYTGLRLGEGLNSHWSQVDWKEDLIHVQRSKKGVFPFVLILPELQKLLRRMQKVSTGALLFPAPFESSVPRDDSSYRRRLAQAAKACGLPHVTPQGLRSYFVTQARQSGLTDAEIAQLIGDKTGPILIAEVYGDVRPDHLLAVARKIKLTAKTRTINKKKGLHKK
jgi:integrase